MPTSCGREDATSTESYLCLGADPLSLRRRLGPPTPQPPASRRRETRLAFFAVSSHCVPMSRRGRPPAATEVQVDEVRRLARQGVSRREIATIVFGDARYR